MIRRAFVTALFLLALALPGRAAADDPKPEVVPLWPNGAPGFESRKDEKEVWKDAAADPVDRLSARPDFQALIYSGPQGIVRQGVTKDVPPTFIVGRDSDNAAN